MNEIATLEQPGINTETPAPALTTKDFSAEALEELKRILEGVLFASDKALTAKQLQALFPEYEAPGVNTIKELLAQLAEEYSARGVRLVELASGYCFRVASFAAPYISELSEEKAPRYSRALLETLAIIAYRQPITRGEIEYIRGVAVSSHIFKTIQERDWIRVLGHKDVPGKPALYGTTKTFLDYFNLKHLSDLPPLATLIDSNAELAEETMASDETISAEMELVEKLENSLEMAETLDAELAAKEMSEEINELEKKLEEQELEEQEQEQEQELEEQEQEKKQELSEIEEILLAENAFLEEK